MTEQLLEEIRDLLIEIKDLLKERSHSSENIGAIGEQKTSSHGEQTWKSHLEKKKPRNDYEIITLAVEWLTRDNKPFPTKDEIIDFIRNHPERIKNTKAKDIDRSINNTKNNSAYGYIELSDQKNKTYRLSIKGEQLVRELPDRIKNTKKKTKRKKRQNHE